MQQLCTVWTQRQRRRRGIISIVTVSSLGLESELFIGVVSTLAVEVSVVKQRRRGRLLVKAEGGDLTALCVVWVNDSVPSGALKLSPSAMEALGTPAAATISFPATPTQTPTASKLR